MLRVRDNGPIMKTVGLIGGMSCESTAEYYRLLNREMNRRLGGHNAKSLIISVDFGEIEPLQRSGDWDRLGEMMAGAARQLERGGADVVLIGANTMHKLDCWVTRAVAIPLLHIGDALAAVIRAAGYGCVGLLGTRFTMEGHFYRERIEAGCAAKVIIPAEASRHIVHDIIYAELVKGVIRAESRAAYQRVIAELHAAGAKAIILGCTELGLLLSAGDSPLPLLDSTEIHASAAIDFALGQTPSTITT